MYLYCHKSALYGCGHSLSFFSFPFFSFSRSWLLAAFLSGHCLHLAIPTSPVYFLVSISLDSSFFQYIWVSISGFGSPSSFTAVVFDFLFLTCLIPVVS